MRSLLLCVCILFSFSISAQNLSDISYGQDNTFEIVTWNIEKFPKNGNGTRDSVAIIVKAIDADILALQEISSKSDFNQLLEDLPGFDGFFDPDFYGGLAYIYKTSTIEILEVSEIYTNNQYWSAFPRAPFVVKFKFQNRTMYSINNHLKCCGNGDLDLNDSGDEETRRYRAMNYLKDYLDDELQGQRVFLVGDLNDELTDNISDNVFRKLLDNEDDFRFTDLEIAEGSSSGWSFPNWPSHLDHIMVTNELFSAVDSPISETSVIEVEDYMQGGFNSYDNKITDHRPVGLKLDASIVSSINEDEFQDQLLTVFPNPASDLVLVELNQVFQNAQLNVHDNLGQLVQTISIVDASKLVEIDLSDVPNGLYFVSIEAKERIQRRSIPLVVSRN